MKTVKSVVNGIVGDYLDGSNNELAYEMAFYREGMPVGNLKSLLVAHPPQQHICILLHGLADDENTWKTSKTDSSDYGTFLQRDLNILPLYIRYNTGLHISKNGQKLSKLMEKFVKANGSWKGQVSFVCHSMGGLVTRSALHYNSADAAANGTTANETDTAIKDEPLTSSEFCHWSRRVARVIFLGSPHHGSPWEQLGNVVSTVVGAVPRPYMKLASKVANLRSSGIQDLRYGYILDEEWSTTSSTSFGDNFVNNKKQALLPNWISYHVVHGTLNTNPDHIVSQAIGDGLVTKPSAQGRSHNPEHHVNLPASVEFPGISHARLANHPLVYQQIKAWVEQPSLLPLVVAEEQPSPDHHFYEEHNDGNTAEYKRDDNMHQDDDEDEVDREPPSKWIDGRGAATLVQDGVCHGVDAVHGVHLAVSDEVFDIVSMVKPIAPVVRSIQAIHNLSVTAIYGMVYGASYGTTEIAKCVCTSMDENTKASEDLSVLSFE